MVTSTIPHAIVRAEARFDLQLSHRDLREISDLIRNKQSIISSAHCRNGSQRHLVRYAGKVLPVIVNPQTFAIITVLPACNTLRTKRKKPHDKRLRRANSDDEDSLHYR